MKEKLAAIAAELPASAIGYPEACVAVDQGLGLGPCAYIVQSNDIPIHRAASPDRGPAIRLTRPSRIPGSPGPSIEPSPNAGVGSPKRDRFDQFIAEPFPAQCVKRYVV